jgi:hypothetical protein
MLVAVFVAAMVVVTVWAMGGLDKVSLLIILGYVATLLLGQALLRKLKN